MMTMTNKVFNLLDMDYIFASADETTVTLVLAGNPPNVSEFGGQIPLTIKLDKKHVEKILE